MSDVDRSGAVDEGSRGRTSLFDLRYLIGTLFVFYGLVLTVASFFVAHPQSGTVDINLWMGLGMAVLGLLFLAWARWRPLITGGPSAAAAARGGRSGRGGRGGPGDPQEGPGDRPAGA